MAEVRPRGFWAIMLGDGMRFAPHAFRDAMRVLFWPAFIIAGLLLSGPVSEGVTGSGHIGTFLLLLLYLAPTFVAGLRNKVHPGAVVVVNVLLGWTLIGWVVALAMAFSGDTKTDRARAMTIAS